MVTRLMLLIGVIMASMYPSFLLCASARDLLEFERAIPLPDSPTDVAWMADGKKLAFRGFYSGLIYIADIDNGSIESPMTTEYRGGAHLAFSQNGAYLGVLSSQGLDLVTTAGWKQVAHLDPSQIPFLTDVFGIAFTPQGHALWLSYSRSSRPPHDDKIDALAFSVPGLAVRGTYASTGRVSPHLAEHPRLDIVTTSQFSVVAGKLALTSIIGDFDDALDDQADGSKTSFIRTVVLGEDGTYSGEKEIDATNLVKPGHEVEWALQVSDAIIARSEQLGVEDLDSPDLMNIDPATGQIRRRFGLTSRQMGYIEPNFLGDSYLVAIEGGGDPVRRTGLIVWDVKTGEILQQLNDEHPLYDLSASPLGDRIASHTIETPNRLRIFRRIRE